MIPLERSICLGSLGNACCHVCTCIKMGPVLTLLSRVQFPSTEKETGIKKKFLFLTYYYCHWYIHYIHAPFLTFILANVFVCLVCLIMSTFLHSTMNTYSKYYCRRYTTGFSSYTDPKYQNFAFSTPQNFNQRLYMFRAASLLQLTEPGSFSIKTESLFRFKIKL